MLGLFGRAHHAAQRQKFSPAASAACLIWSSLDKEAADYPAKLAGAVADVVEKKSGGGIDIINEGEYAKGGRISPISRTVSAVSGRGRLPGAVHLLAQGKDRADFAAYYQYPTEKAHAVLRAGRADPSHAAGLGSAPSADHL